ncbi:kinase-like protein, partial [Auricularia subglabra TFB-10046 SS5]
TPIQGPVRATGKLVIMKEEDGSPLPRTVMREIGILKTLKHPNILSLVDQIVNEAGLVLIMEYCDLDLKGFMVSLGRDGALDPCTVWALMIQLLGGVAFCHEKNVTHLDLKPQNISIQNAIRRLKIGDFGMARASGQPEVKTLWYRAPEVSLGGDTYGAQTDTWSCGCIFAEMITGRVLFAGKDSSGQLKLVVGTTPDTGSPGTLSVCPFVKLYAHAFQVISPRQKTSFQAVVPNASAEAADLLDSMLQMEPRARLEPVHALAHAYF